MGLTSKQESFCQEIVKGKTQYKSYCIAYPEQAENSQRAVLDTNASMLMDNTKIVLRIKELREPIIKKLNITVEKLVTELEQIKALALNEGSKELKTAIKAIEEQGKLTGLYVVKKDIKTDGNMNPTIIINTNLKKQCEE